MELSEALQALSEAGYRPAAAPALLASMGAAATAIAAHDAGAAAPRSAAHAEALGACFHDQLVEIHRLVGGSNWPQLAFVRRHALDFAERGLPLADALLAGRAALPHIRTWLEAAIPPGTPQEGVVAEAVGAFLAAWHDNVTAVLAAEYVERARQLAAGEADRRARLFDLLLDGSADAVAGLDATWPGLVAGEPARARHCVIALRPADGAPMQEPTRADRLLAATRAALGEASVDALYGLRRGRVVVIASAAAGGDGDGAGGSDSAASLSEHVGWPLMRLGQGIVAGVSAETSDAARLPDALREAEVALELAGPGQRVVQYRDIPLRRLVVHLARRDVRPALPRWTGDFLSADRRAKGILSETLRGYAAADMNVLRTAKALHIHPNTVYGRIRKVREVTGLDPTRFDALSNLLLALDCLGQTAPAEGG